MSFKIGERLILLHLHCCVPKKTSQHHCMGRHTTSGISLPSDSISKAYYQIYPPTFALIDFTQIGDKNLQKMRRFPDNCIAFQSAVSVSGLSNKKSHPSPVPIIRRSPCPLL